VARPRRASSHAAPAVPTAAKITRSSLPRAHSPGGHLDKCAAYAVQRRSPSGGVGRYPFGLSAPRCPDSAVLRGQDSVAGEYRIARHVLERCTATASHSCCVVAILEWMPREPQGWNERAGRVMSLIRKCESVPAAEALPSWGCASFGIRDTSR
jgi:hypothetical protein